MFRSLRGVRGYAVQGINGDAGLVEDFLFDDRDWTVRQIVVRENDSKEAHRALIAPVSYISANEGFESIYVMLTKEQVMEYCLDVCEAPPVRDQRAANLAGDPHLRSFNEILTYRVLTPQGASSGAACDLVCEDKTWHIKALVIRSASGPAHISTERVSKVSWRDKTIQLAADFQPNRNSLAMPPVVRQSAAA